MSQPEEAFEDGNIRTDDIRNQPRNATSDVSNSVLHDKEHEERLRTFNPVNRSRYPWYCDFFARLDTFFASPPQDLYLHPVDLAASGLYYTGIGDEAQCFHCGGTLRWWKPGDDPDKEHALWYPDCEYMNWKRTNDPSVRDNGLCQHRTFAPVPGCEDCIHRCGRAAQRRITVFHNAHMEKLSQEGRSGATDQDRALVDRMLVNLGPCHRIAMCDADVLRRVAMGLSADTTVDQFKKRFHVLTCLGRSREWFTNPIGLTGVMRMAIPSEDIMWRMIAHQATRLK